MEKDKFNILFLFTYEMRIGGHFKSALAMAKYLIRKGNNVIIAAPGGRLETLSEYKKVGAEFVELNDLSTRSLIPSFKGIKILRKLIKEKDVDIIHAEEYHGIARAYLLSVLLKKQAVYSIAGGPFLRLILPDSIHGVFFSKEWLEALNREFGVNKNYSHLIPARIDTEIYKSSDVDYDYIDSLNLPLDGKKIFMAIRLDISKFNLLDNILNFASRYDKPEKISIIVAGEGSHYKELKHRAEEINRKNTGCHLRLYIIKVEIAHFCQNIYIDII